ncbi:hypothetical protein J2T13_005152 [Paenibacillus sp. DS2015]|uniref:hypothetical protein n=1 Tax=Paenibacillus sp. DS2015 TaxID=3373917 RepID=UPI003D219EA3
MSAMKKYITELEELTAALLQRIEEVGYEELAMFSEQRARIILHMEQDQAVFAAEDEERLRKLCGYDEVILSTMNSLKQEASEWLLKQGAIKEQKTAYGANYDMESLFVDHKK